MRSIKLLVAILLAIALALSLGLIGCTTPAEEEEEEEEEEIFELSLSSAYPQCEPPTAAWIEKIESETNGRVQITAYFALHDMANALPELEAGVADIAVVPVGIQPGMPIANAMDSFGYGCPEEYKKEIAWELWDEFPEWREEYASVKTLGWAGGVESQYIMTNEPVYTVEDIEGMVLRGLSFHVQPFQRMGAEIVSMPVTETYTAVEKGTVEGAILPPSFFESYSFYEVVDYATCLYMVGPFAFPFYCMNLDVWNSLPSDIQQIIDDSIEPWSEEWMQWSFEQDQAGVQIAIDNGVQVIEFSAAELATAYGFYEEVALEVAADLDAQGLPGTEILEAMRGLIEEHS